LIGVAVVTVYTDGSSLGNPGPGGYGAVLISGNRRKEIYGGFSCTTNNRMELKAVIEALKCLKGSRHQVAVYSDSRYVVDAFVRGWLDAWKQREWKKVKNTDLWMELWSLTQHHRVSWHWIKGHNQNPENEACDRMARLAASGSSLPEDTGYTADNQS